MTEKNFKKDIEEIRSVVQRLVEQHNTLVDRFNKVAWMEEQKKEIISSVQQAILNDLAGVIKVEIEKAFIRFGLNIQKATEEVPVV